MLSGYPGPEDSRTVKPKGSRVNPARCLCNGDDADNKNNGTEEGVQKGEYNLPLE
jgi:hypothetical protein